MTIIRFLAGKVWGGGVDMKHYGMQCWVVLVVLWYV